MSALRAENEGIAGGLAGMGLTQPGASQSGVAPEAAALQGGRPATASNMISVKVRAQLHVQYGMPASAIC